MSRPTVLGQVAAGLVGGTILLALWLALWWLAGLDVIEWGWPP